MSYICIACLMNVFHLNPFLCLNLIYANVECIDGMFFNNPDKLQKYIRNKNPGIELKAFKKASEESCSCWYR